MPFIKSERENPRSLEVGGCHRIKSLEQLNLEVPLFALRDIKINQEILIDYRYYGDRLYKAERYKKPSCVSS
jgi:hypothetical protein